MINFRIRNGATTVLVHGSEGSNAKILKKSIAKLFSLRHSQVQLSLIDGSPIQDDVLLGSYPLTDDTELYLNILSPRTRASGPKEIASVPSSFCPSENHTSDLTNQHQPVLQSVIAYTEKPMFSPLHEKTHSPHAQTSSDEEGSDSRSYESESESYSELPEDQESYSLSEEPEAPQGTEKEPTSAVHKTGQKEEAPETESRDGVGAIVQQGDQQTHQTIHKHRHHHHGQKQRQLERQQRRERTGPRGHRGEHHLLRGHQRDGARAPRGMPKNRAQATRSVGINSVTE